MTQILNILPFIFLGYIVIGLLIFITMVSIHGFDSDQSVLANIGIALIVIFTFPFFIELIIESTKDYFKARAVTKRYKAKTDKANRKR